MKAVVLSAGIGSRMSSITDKKPKTLVNVNGKPMLSYILRSLDIPEIDEILICVGYKHEKIKEYVLKNFSHLNIKYVLNKDYLKTNNMYSLFLAKEYLTEDFLLMNADLVFEKEIIRRMVKVNKNLVAVDKGVYNEESMKIIVNENKIKSISKKISEDIAYGCSIDIYRIQKESIPILIKEMEKIIIQQNDKNQWTEKMLDNLFISQKLISEPFDIEGKKWYEIDNVVDLVEAEKMFNNKLKKLSKIKAFFIDRDGTLTLGNSQLDGANKFIEKLNAQNKHFFILTNNSSKTPKQHLETFKGLNIDVELENILVSTQPAITYLKNHNLTEIFWLANDDVSKYLKSEGLKYNEETPQAILLTYDTQINYSKLKKVIKFIRQKIPYFATHIDYICPTKDGPIPDVGSFIEMIKGSTKKEPQKTFGKPNLSMILGKLKEINVNLCDAAIIGDRLYTDIKMAENNELTSILVLSGETSREIYENSNIKSDIICQSLNDLEKYI